MCRLMLLGGKTSIKNFIKLMNVLVSARNAMLLLDEFANDDRNVDAFLSAAQLMQEGDIFEKHLPNAYYALLRAQELGADVSEQLKILEPQLTSNDSERGKWYIEEGISLALTTRLPQSPHPSCSYSSR